MLSDAGATRFEAVSLFLVVNVNVSEISTQDRTDRTNVNVNVRFSGRHTRYSGILHYLCVSSDSSGAARMGYRAPQVGRVVGVYVRSSAVHGLTVMCSCVALAVKMLLESDSEIMVLMLAFGLIMSLMSLMSTYVRRAVRHADAHRDIHETAWTLWWLELIRSTTQSAQGTAHTTTALPSTTSESRALRSEQMELSVRSAL